LPSEIFLRKAFSGNELSQIAELAATKDHSGEDIPCEAAQKKQLERQSGTDC